MLYNNDFPIFRSFVHGVDIKIPLADNKYVPEINFDNAATTPPLKTVLSEVLAFSPMYSSIHRGTGYKSRYSSYMYEKSREIIGEFVGADLNKDTIVFVKNATEAINKLSYRLDKKNGRNVILSTNMEHHSNDLPWRKRFKVDYIDIDDNGRLSLSDLEYKLKKYSHTIRLVTVTGISNVTGYINPIYTIAELAHKYNAEILVDGAQLVAHAPINMHPKNPNNHIDYLVFSAHKMYAPFGIGVLIGPRKSFEEGDPDYAGGGTVEIVTHDYVKWTKPPHKEEAGSPNIIGVIALSAAMKTLKNLGLQNIHEYEKILTKYAIEGLKLIPDLKIYGDTNNYTDRIGIITFNIKGIHHEILANILSYEAGIAVRNGCFCAHPYLHKLLNVSNEVIEKRIKNSNLPHPGMVRISFGMYNSKEEINILINALNNISNNKNYYLNKYEKKSARFHID
ncbi:aminotransferase class V-fold PLP-dependent enzyme [Paramaledivibacter caminithermalis]|jgi:selenocysteine lyase/cysteine desulfurase|uniref:Selenocysteine lyase/Cysteine desulfurase n=1 Tax=Paramaledivibacter caminithermalis (strain DSM 15212 / CIP 107654 / DViRD3) TaxID=1121301 RepID=A0A1M6KU79_PARC5|nr:aminotransferase class V-fold PLP-dependent enzyme [Paramaledivibacter caminithermalis]SHJ62525.1 Selenocysteine lyase/Cysteine desulfurase [Paramaledivibacter caminithermalis DSM 15212]